MRPQSFCTPQSSQSAYCTLQNTAWNTSSCNKTIYYCLPHKLHRIHMQVLTDFSMDLALRTKIQPNSPIDKYNKTRGKRQDHIYTDMKDKATKANSGKLTYGSPILAWDSLKWRGKPALHAPRFLLILGSKNYGDSPLSTPLLFRDTFWGHQWLVTGRLIRWSSIVHIT